MPPQSIRSNNMTPKKYIVAKILGESISYMKALSTTNELLAHEWLRIAMKWSEYAVLITFPEYK